MTVLAEPEVRDFRSLHVPDRVREQALVINRVIDYMSRRLDEDITIDDMARQARYSKFHFSRIFAEMTGKTPGRYLAHLRFQRAAQLLVTTNTSVTEISNQVGYSSVGTFSTYFTRNQGCSPTTYRRLNTPKPAPPPPPEQPHG